MAREGPPRRAGEAAAAFETVIVDTAPTGHTLRLLAAPALLGRVAGLLDHLQSHHRAVVSALRGSYREDAADALIAELEREGADAGARCFGIREASEMSWVTLPEPMALEETSDALAALAAAGIPVRRLIVNRDHAAASATRCELVRGAPALRGARAGARSRGGSPAWRWLRFRSCPASRAASRCSAARAS